MERTYINEAQKAIGGTVKVQGFIENLRNSKYMAFIVLKDITGKLQITVEKADHPELVDTIDEFVLQNLLQVYFFPRRYICYIIYNSFLRINN